VRLGQWGCSQNEPRPQVMCSTRVFSGQTVTVGSAVMRRKGELSATRIDRDWPHQMVLKANDCLGQNDTIMRAFCEGLSLSPRGHSYVENGEWMRVWCFAEKADAESGESGSTLQGGGTVRAGRS
jgi:hypothetical protein